MSNPLISVIVPVHNGRDYVINCIESIEKQIYSPLEIIVIDDGSTDDTREVLEEYLSVSNHENMRLLSMDDRGVSAARNFGIKSSSGEFISFVDADDRIMPDTISRLYNSLVTNEADVAGCKFTMWSTENEWKQSFENNLQKDEHCYTSKEYLSDQILSGNSRCWSKLYKRSLLNTSSELIHPDKVSFTEGLTIGEDMLFLVDLLPHVNRWVEIDYPGYGYFQNPKGAMYRPFTMKYLDQIRCWELARERVVKIDSTTERMITRNLVIGIMLVIGKIATVSKVERCKLNDTINCCHSKLIEEMKRKGLAKLLPWGYKIKTFLFTLVPKLYIEFYHFSRNIKDYSKK